MINFIHTLHTTQVMLAKLQGRPTVNVTNDSNLRIAIDKFAVQIFVSFASRKENSDFKPGQMEPA